LRVVIPLGLAFGFIIHLSSNFSIADSYLKSLHLPEDNPPEYESSSELTSESETVTLKRWNKYMRRYRYTAASPRFDYPYWMYPTKECGSGPGFDNFFRLPLTVRSRLGEDSFIYKTFFEGKNITGEDGTYIELGAYDGSTESNTHFFDKCLGWRGLLIEGNPENFNKVIGNRPFAHKMSFAPSCSSEYERVNHTVPFYRYPMTNVGMAGAAKSYKGKPTVDVPCGPLNPVLEDVFQKKPILFFSLDVEGAEKMVLDTIDFKRVIIYVLMIEIKNNDCHNDSCLVRKQVRAHMEKEGYKRYEGLVHASDIYVHPESPYQIP
jgi:hypothetical protein